MPPQAAKMTMPAFDELPLDPSGPPGNAWGLFGQNDQLGRLNLLTPEVVAAAAAGEVREGIRISLDWPLDKPVKINGFRQKFEHRILEQPPMALNDDAVSFNTQCTTQWDGFRHYAFQRTKQFYQGHVQSDFAAGVSGPLGIDAYAENGGIVGRGVLIDWYSWAEANGKTLPPFETGAVRGDELKTIVAENEIQTKPGDILFIRCGFTAAHSRLTVSEQKGFPDRQPSGYLGLEATKDSLRWLWDSQFAAVASDSASFERGPATGAYNDPEVTIHQWALAGWGMPIGEMFDLERLAAECRQRQRWTFFLCSVPLKIPGGVGSPGNAVAIL